MLPADSVLYWPLGRFSLGDEQSGYLYSALASVLCDGNKNKAEKAAKREEMKRRKAVDQRRRRTRGIERREQKAKGAERK